MRHAYMIMAHDQFLSLKELVAVLDDERNDIYVHFDRKLKSVPELSARHSNLTVLKKRVSVIWGDVSQIKAEYEAQYGPFTPGIEGVGAAWLKDPWPWDIERGAC